ncbi:hypothetical protein CR159_04915 [Pollutimonas subterranea]|uniref:Lipoprotein n=1 Tax=Pollutimonas subterranea TaxID=2045210 RepID=A0A2N4U7E2_9BURK|nr:hypothetical protein [Pollutimonas subterranea]PLC50941.1 hypothetical protein CR159_04915 [Pollutimonas subterranea]
MKKGSVACAVLTTILALSGCMSVGVPSGAPQPRDEAMSFDQLGQTDFNRTVTIAMRDNLDSLSRLLEKLYRRNPGEWRKTGARTMQEAVQRGRQAIQTGQAPSDLAALRDTEILSVALDPAYQGDRVGTIIFGLSDMIIRAHNGKIRFYATDVLNAQHVYNAARNVEIAAWLLATRRDALGRPLLLANEISNDISNLSFEREFGQLVGRLDLVANLLDENLRRVGINYVQGLLFFNFLPVR